MEKAQPDSNPATESKASKETVVPAVIPDNLPLEDMVMKQAMQYFGEELLPFLGIHQKMALITPTEQIYLEARRWNEDYNFTAEDGSWHHFEFESDALSVEDLRRFRGYESVISYTYHVPVTTYVICSSTVRHIRSVLREGINTYRVKIIRLKDWNADQLFQKLFQKKERGEMLGRDDLIPLLVSPLMSGSMSVADRIIEGSRILQTSELITKDEQLKMQAVLYALANKFLESSDLAHVKEVLSMTRLGEMLVKDGYEKGVDEGIKKGLKEGISVVLSLLQEMGISKQDAQAKIENKFSLTHEASTAFMERYWKS